MGVPKFFRYISERYPCLSEIVKEHQIPQFDNLYLDMNGIIHTCSHPEDDDPHFRITEEKIFQDIFHYIEVLFRMIKPGKLFFMAVDGVAPRAKMNQQRARRFRSAKDAEKLEEKARKKGETLPSEARFDSNCITPGTVFMAKLHEQLKYFVVNKISTDKLWRRCKIILSGHETPGEGEHKIMDYIRYIRAQPGYNPNTRHCLYGLDADLIMLGLCTHEPHFSLLREEVKFGKKSTKRKSSPEEITFYLLHLSLMREYLELEFKELENNKEMKFSYDIEKIIDDWVLMGFLVGNDFIPNLPNLHISSGSLPVLYQTYMKVLPSFSGYINEEGTLNLQRFEKFMQALAAIDLDYFQEQYADIKYFEMKTGRRPNSKQRKSYKPEETNNSTNADTLIDLKVPEPPKVRYSELDALIKATQDELFPKSEKLNYDTNDDEIFGYEEGEDSDSDDLLEEEFLLHKRDYYTNKLEYENVTSEVLQAQAEGYVRAIQWNLNYYYNGVSSWSWFYPQHYAPYISDIKGFADLKLEFELGTPFLPYEQLLAVLPAASKNLLPEPYHHLMTDQESLIKSYYPEEFETDLNGKKAEWEAVVLIPFIDEEKLLNAMKECNLKLTHEEAKRNTHGPMLIYEYTSTLQEKYEAPQYFPPVVRNSAVMKQLTIEDIRVPKKKLVKGAYPGVKLDIYFPGFPTTKHLKYTHHLEKAHVKVHEQPSRNESMILKVDKPLEAPGMDIVARDLLGRTVYVAWPHLVEGLVVAISNKHFWYRSTKEPGQYNVIENKGNLDQSWTSDCSGIIEHYRNRFGVDADNPDALVHVKVLIGRRYMFTKQGRATLEKQWATVTSAYPLHIIVRDIRVHDESYSSFRDLVGIFPPGSFCFMLGHPYYGSMGQVRESKEALQNGRIEVLMQCCNEPNFDSTREFEKSARVRYMSSYEASSKLAVSKQLFTRVTGSILVSTSSRFHSTEDTNKINIGLNLKFSKKNEELPGYTKRDGNLWLYSDKVIDLVRAYSEFCPQLFEFLNSHNENVYYSEDMFPEDNSKERLSELSAWIKSQPYYFLERRPCGGFMIEPEVVKKIEEVVSEFKNKEKPKDIVMKVKPHLLYKADLYIGNVVPDSNSTFLLYDRVINVRESFSVPLGLRGTVIAIHKSQTDVNDEGLYDVVFDEEFAGGLSLNCSANRGYRLPKAALINKSYGQREYEMKAGKSGELMQQMKTNTRQNTDVPQKQYTSFVPCTSKSGPPLYVQSNPFIYKNGHNNMYINTLHPPIVPLLPQRQMIAEQSKTFFPTFGNNEKSKTVIVYQSPESKQGSGTQQQIYLANKASSSQKTPKVDTDFLKKILKIPENPKAATTQAQKQVKVEDIFMHAKNKPLAPVQGAPETNVKDSLKLFSYYQSNRLGCPHYSYFNLPDKTVQAQLINPLNGQLVCGEPSTDKAEACENAAREVLKLMEHLSLQQTPVPPIPQPPITWCQQQPVQDKRVNMGKSKQYVTSGVTSSPFVPLQAVVNHKNRNAHANKHDYIKQGGSNSTHRDERTYRMTQMSKGTADPGASVQKPYRKRTMRIAANFATKFEQK